MSVGEGGGEAGGGGRDGRAAYGVPRGGEGCCVQGDGSVDEFVLFPGLYHSAPVERELLCRGGREEGKRYVVVGETGKGE